jgi:predicted small lipoprotein YifL
MKTSVALLALLTAAACGDSKPKEMPDAGIDAPPPFAEAMPTSMPQLIDLGGPVLAAPKVQPIFFANDALQP